jgi:ankyrin repeat protein
MDVPHVESGCTPVGTAAQNNNVKVLRFLHSCGCNMETPKRNGVTPVWSAAQEGHVDVLRFLHECGCDMSTPRDSGATPAYIAAMQNNVAALRFLRDCGCDIDAPAAGATVVFAAAKEGLTDVLRLLHESGCDMSGTYRPNGQTAAHTAASSGHTDVLRFLCNDCGLESDMSRPSNQGFRPVHMAAQGGHAYSLSFLLSISSVDFISANPYGGTTSFIAKLHGHQACVDLIEDAVRARVRPFLITLENEKREAAIQELLEGEGAGSINKQETKKSKKSKKQQQQSGAAKADAGSGAGAVSLPAAVASSCDGLDIDDLHIICSLACAMIMDNVSWGVSPARLRQLVSSNATISCASVSEKKMKKMKTWVLDRGIFSFTDARSEEARTEEDSFPSLVQDDDLCTICMDGQISVTLIHPDGTGHSIVCRLCAARLADRQMSCPMCRQPIVEQRPM